MIVPMVLRIVVLSLIAAFLLPGLTAASTHPVGTREESQTTQREDLFVQECNGFDAFTDYTVTRDYRFVTDLGGNLVFERRHVQFTGAFANGETGRALPYQGEFTRIADYEQGQIVVAGLAVHLDLPDAGSLGYAVEQRDGDLTDDPLAVLGELATHATTTALCDLLDGVPSGDPTGPPDLLCSLGPVGEPPSVGISMEGVWVGNQTC